MKHRKREQNGWGEGRIPAVVLALMFVLSLLTAMNRLPRTFTVEPVHAVSVDLYDFARIDLNSASFEELVDLPSVGETLAQRIVDARPFSSVDDLLRVDGIGETILEELRPLVKTG